MYSLFGEAKIFKLAIILGSIFYHSRPQGSCSLYSIVFLFVFSDVSTFCSNFGGFATHALCYCLFFAFWNVKSLFPFCKNRHAPSSVALYVLPCTSTLVVLSKNNHPWWDERRLQFVMRSSLILAKISHDFWGF